jgi:hypothetical protein
MAKVFEDRTTDYDGEAFAADGSGVVKVYFWVSKQRASVLKLMVRKSSTTDPFIPLRADTGNVAYAWDATDWEYYFTWDIAPSYEGNCTATLDA